MRDHTSLEAWREARWLTRYAITLSREAWKPWAATVLEQLQRAALSVQLNLAEGYALRGAKRFCNHLTIAYGSAVEVTDLIELVQDEGIGPAAFSTEARRHSRRCQALVLGLLKRYRRDIQ